MGDVDSCAQITCLYPCTSQFTVCNRSNMLLHSTTMSCKPSIAGPERFSNACKRRNYTESLAARVFGFGSGVTQHFVAVFPAKEAGGC